jgi:hypothetical protein
MAKSLKDCCSTIRELFKSNKTSRATISVDFFRDIVDRHRIEGVFIAALNRHAMENFKFGIMKLDPYRYMVFKTTDKYFKEDSYVTDDDE